MRYRPSLSAWFLGVLVAVCSAFVCAASASATTWNTLSNPIDPTQYTNMPFGELSYWLQPWRSELVTQPATELQNAIGINVDNEVSQAEWPATARLLHDSGFTRARIEINWDQMSYTNPSQIANPAKWTTFIAGMRANGLRPLIVLNASASGPTPTPTTNMTLNLTAPAAKGATTVTLDPASKALVVAGLTGFTLNSVAASVIITSVNALDVATLSRPLPSALPAGPAAATTLLYPPFAPPYLPGGVPNPRFQQTLTGWLAYVKGACQFVAKAYGSDNFDVEVWNENETFLSEANYFNPVPDPTATGVPFVNLLQATIKLLRDPTTGLPDVKIGDGFTDKTPFVSGAQVPPGTDAIDKHPYAPNVQVTQASAENGIQPVNALGLPKRAASGIVQPIFTPSFHAFFPEYYLTGMQTETLMRDLSPITTLINGVPHGSTTHPNGSPPPAMWITEDGMDAVQAGLNGLPTADLLEMQAKAAMRYYTAFASMGVPMLDLFAIKGGLCCQLVSQAFFDAVDANPASYPANLAGQVMQSVGRMASTLAGAQPIASPRQLTLSAIAQYGNNSQFTGNGVTGYPDLYDRDALAFFPYQVSQNKFVASVYVMTRDLTHLYTSTPASGQTPYDMPPEWFELTIGNLNGASAAVSYYDPLTGTNQTATIVSRTSSQIVVALPATDSPRMLTITD